MRHSCRERDADNQRTLLRIENSQKSTKKILKSPARQQLIQAADNTNEWKRVQHSQYSMPLPGQPKATEMADLPP